MGDELRRWTPFGYATIRVRRKGTGVNVLTPASIVDVIRGGYRPSIHQGA